MWIVINILWWDNNIWISTISIHIVLTGCKAFCWSAKQFEFHTVENDVNGGSDISGWGMWYFISEHMIFYNLINFKDLNPSKALK